MSHKYMYMTDEKGWENACLQSNSIIFSLEIFWQIIDFVFFDNRLFQVLLFDCQLILILILIVVSLKSQCNIPTIRSTYYLLHMDGDRVSNPSINYYYYYWHNYYYYYAHI